MFLNTLKNVPIIKKGYLSNVNQKQCNRYDHGTWYEESQICRYYMQAKKICIVIDEITFEPVENYENFVCDTIDFKEGFIKW